MREVFDFKLPAELDCAELYFDTTYLDHSVPIPKSTYGDLVWLGRPSTQSARNFQLHYDTDGTLINWNDFPVNHVGMIVSRGGDNPRILHASQKEGTNVISTLKELSSRQRYDPTHGISRLKEQFRFPAVKSS